MWPTTPVDVWHTSAPPSLSQVDMLVNLISQHPPPVNSFQGQRFVNICHRLRPVHLIIMMIKWIRTGRLSIKNSLSLLSLSTLVETFWSMDMARRILGFTPNRARNGHLKPSRPRLLPVRPKVCTNHVHEPLRFPKRLPSGRWTWRGASWASRRTARGTRGTPGTCSTR